MIDLPKVHAFVGPGGKIRDFTQVCVFPNFSVCI